MLFRLFIHSSLIVMLARCQPPASKDTGSRGQQPATTQSPTTTQDSTLTDIGASSFMLLQGSSMVSLASVAGKSSSALTVFQFAGVDCESCKTEGPYINSALAKFGSKVTRMVIFPNKESEYSTARYAEFTKNYAGNSAYLIDDSLAVIKKVRAKTTQYFGVYILVAKDGKGMIMNQDNAYRDVEAAVTRALNQ